jgi:hypothetical protein
LHCHTQVNSAPEGLIPNLPDIVSLAQDERPWLTNISCNIHKHHNFKYLLAIADQEVTTTEPAINAVVKQPHASSCQKMFVDLLNELREMSPAEPVQVCVIDGLG